MRAGSLPTSASVSRNALISLVHRGSHFFFCSSVPYILIGCGTPMDWCADSNVDRVGCIEPASAQALL